MNPDMLRAYVFFRRLFRDVHIANAMSRVAVAYWAGERAG